MNEGLRAAANTPAERHGASALYVGSVEHRRSAPVVHALRVPLFMVYLDLSELDRVFRGRWLWSTRRPALAWFRRADHFGDPATPLDRSVRDLVEARTLHRPRGPIRLLTHLRYLGVGMNPASFYYCYDPAGERLDAIVVEVHNTPWREKHCYVLDARDQHAAAAMVFEVPKAFHVSPFMGMDLRHRFRVVPPGEHLEVGIENLGGSGAGFTASLRLERRPLTGRHLAGALLRFPLMTWTVLAGIYGHALLLWLKGVPVHPHPRTVHDPRKEA